ncbi:exodeoxyribonuclease VIII [Kosakonia phage Kc166B]|nr:exodeoxyribonuclease VIII [Kosakonia phage Kc166B]
METVEQTEKPQTYFVRAYSSSQLSNEAYHADDEYITGSSLFKMLQSSPAGWRFSEEEERQKAITARQEKQKPMAFGTTGHCVLLEPERFESEFFRMPVQEEFKDLLTSDAAMKSWLKARGIKGYSALKTDELIREIHNTGEAVNIWADIFDNAQKEAGEREQVPGKDYDKVLRMREVIMSNGSYADIINNGQPEISIYCVIDGVPVKVRLDYVSPQGDIIDYKTTVSANPERFGRHAFDMGYWLKMALQHDCFKLAYGRAPNKTSLLAQEKEPPFLVLRQNLTPGQLAVGRMQYRTAIQLFAACRAADVWPSYANGKNEIDLETPPYIYSKFRHIFEQFEGEK